MSTTLNTTWAILDKKEKKQFVVLLVLGIIISIADILALVALLWIISFYIQPDNTNRLSFLPNWLIDRDSIMLIAIFLILFTIKNIAAFLIARSQSMFTSNVAIRLSANTLTNYQHSSFTEFVTIDSSALIRKIALQPFDFSQQVLSGVQQIITQLFLILLALAAIVLFNAKLFLLLLAILLPPVIVVFFLIRKKLASTKKELKDNNERSYKYLLDALKGYVEGNIFQRNSFFLQRFINYRSRFSVNLFNSLSLQNLPGRAIEVFAVLGLFILILIAKWTGHNDNSTLITIGAFMAAAYKIIPGIVKVINLSGQIKAYEFSIEELTTVLKNEEKITGGAVSANIQSIEFKDVSFNYGEKEVLKNLSFTIKEGDFLGISGESGIGKTTIMNLLLGFLPPTSGEIFINNFAADNTLLKKYRVSVAYVRQQSFFIHDTILRNITLSEKEYNKQNLEDALHLTGLDKLISTFPEGLNKIITENGKNISGGQQQRIAIARAIYKNADLILLDEPLNELDEASTEGMLKHFRDLSVAGKIIAMITHDKKGLALCNKTIVLNGPR